MKRTLSIQPVQNGWVVRDMANFDPMSNRVGTIPRVADDVWVFNSKEDLVKELPGIMEPCGPTPVMADNVGARA